MSWYRTYRPTTLAGLHLTDVRANLLRLLDTNQFPHALLFAGPKGTGKTSAARIMSAILNDPQNAAAVDQLFFAKSVVGVAAKSAAQKVTLHEPDPTSEIVQRIQRGSSFAVQELDAASNRGIDDIRQLKERVYLQPQEGKISVYILDEVHMLTTEAFNALLKLLEEPPAHVVFILATTELHKLPETVVSRMTVIHFHTASVSELTVALTAILSHEKIEFAPAAVEQISVLAEGSFRDAVKLLEQVAAGKKELTEADVVAVFQLSSATQQLALVEAISQKDPPAVVAFFAELRTHQVNEQFFYHGWLQFLHQQLIQAVMAGQVGAKAVAQPPLLVPQKVSHYLLSQFHHLPLDTAATIPFLALELKSLEIVFRAKEQAASSGEKAAGGKGSSAPVQTGQTGRSIAREGKAVAQPTSMSPASLQELANVVPIAVVEYQADEATSLLVNHVVTDQAVSEVETKPAIELVAKWTQFLSELRKTNLTLEAMLRSATPRVGAEGKAQIEVYYAFHREQLEQPKFLRILDDCITHLLGGRVQLEFVLAQKAQSGAASSTVSGRVNEEDHLIQLAKDILV